MLIYLPWQQPQRAAPSSQQLCCEPALSHSADAGESQSTCEEIKTTTTFCCVDPLTRSSQIIRHKADGEQEGGSGESTPARLKVKF